MAHPPTVELTFGVRAQGEGGARVRHGRGDIYVRAARAGRGVRLVLAVGRRVGPRPVPARRACGCGRAVHVYADAVHVLLGRDG